MEQQQFSLSISHYTINSVLTWLMMIYPPPLLYPVYSKANWAALRRKSDCAQFSIYYLCAARTTIVVVNNSNINAACSFGTTWKGGKTIDVFQFTSNGGVNVLVQARLIPRVAVDSVSSLSVTVGWQFPHLKYGRGLPKNDSEKE